jgi:hypothetical protein
MRLANRFKEEDKISVWLYHPYCAICNSNQGCALHHIDGTVTDSILSSIMLCDVCHIEADAHNVSDEEYKINLMTYSLPIIFKSNYQMKERDYKYAQSIEERLKIVNSML